MSSSGVSPQLDRPAQSPNGVIRNSAAGLSANVDTGCYKGGQPPEPAAVVMLPTAGRFTASASIPPLPLAESEHPGQRLSRVSETLHKQPWLWRHPLIGRTPVRVANARVRRSDRWQRSRDDPVSSETPRRSEEHTSELQSRQYLVCRL